jgi:hypothetical protein
MTGIPGGKVEDDTLRVMMVTLNPLATSAEVIGAPKLPDPYKFVNKSSLYEVKNTCTKDGDFTESGHFK